MRFVFSALIAVSIAGVARAAVVADYQGDFNTSGTPAPGWSYLQSSQSSLGNSASYVPLVHTANLGGDYEAQASTGDSNAAPASFPAAAKTTVFPGQTGSGQFVVLGYKFTADQIAADGNQLQFHTYDFNIPAGNEDPIEVDIFRNNTPLVPPGYFKFPAGTSFSDAIYGQDYNFGTVAPGDTLYIALGATGNYSGQPLGVSYTLALVPEPATFSLIGLAGVAALRRRRR